MARGNRVLVTLECKECKRRNYHTNKNKRTTTNKLEFKKYDPVVRKHVMFTEMKMPNPKKQG